ncbi:DUF6095 family protein [Cellulophaga sp. F20128]|uniref:DUF6095 family protein n=1 Tax=Cellulophaga sp. F20128 TaxID=2926413 RepID=UPI001FF67311|nr:DUF6095 family protein [Cellulophaga sp. F20128]MCK0157216.1 DUF6095 family protein [Cellulophaga sp. F20128]
MSTQPNSFYKSLKFFALTVVLMFSGPIVIYQAFKNESHPFYLPVLIIGFLLAIAALGVFYYSLRLMMTAIFGEKEKKNKKQV